MDTKNIRKQLYQLTDSFLVEYKDQHGNERSIDRLNQDRHLFVDNALQLIKGVCEEAIDQAITATEQRVREEMVYKIRQVLCSEDVLSLSVEKAIEEMMKEVQNENNQ